MALSDRFNTFVKDAVADPQLAKEMIDVLNVAQVLSSAEAAVIDGVTAGTAAANKAAVLGASKNIDTLKLDTSFGLGVTPVAQGAALTAQLTTLTHTAPGADDFAIAALTTTTPFGFVAADEGHTVLKVIANLQTRLAEVEARLEAFGLVAAN